MPTIAAKVIARHRLPSTWSERMIGTTAAEIIDVHVSVTTVGVMKAESITC